MFSPLDDDFADLTILFNFYNDVSVQWSSIEDVIEFLKMAFYMLSDCR